MLTHIHIKNFAIVENLEIEFLQGFSVLTGETGAGKSILIDALQLALGDRAEANIVRTGAERCEISASFSLTNIPEAQQWLITHEFASDQECVLRRSITLDGRSRCTINGITCPQQLLKELSALLVNVHGQHEHQALLKKDKQRTFLDNYAEHEELLQNVKQAYSQWREAKGQLEQLTAAGQDRHARVELLRYQVQELKDLALEENEIGQLDQEHKKLVNAEQLINRCNSALQLLSDNEENSINKSFYTVLRQLDEIKNLDDKIAPIIDLLNQALIQADEAGDELKNYLHNLDINIERLQVIDERLSLIHQLARKHHISANHLFDFHKKLSNELHQLEHLDELATTLEKKITVYEEDFMEAATQLSDSRKKAAQKLSRLVTEEIQTLGMRGGKFNIEFETIQEINPAGIERVEFMISANPGQALHALNKVASGGELSRIGLAIQVIIAQKDNTPTLIFDEVDVGIGGGTAEIVGKLLRSLGEKAQVLCITHLPQVAAQGHYHFMVKKQSAKNSTQTKIQLLSAPERVEEIARMLGGIKISEQTLMHAKEMLVSAQ